MSDRLRRSSMARTVLLLFGAAVLCLPAASEMKVPAVVRGPAGEFVTDASPASLQAWIEDQPAAIQSVQGPGANLVLLVVMDLVGDLNRIEAARNGLIEALEEMGPNEYVAVLQAQDGLEVLQDPATDRDLVRETVLGVPVSGYPGLLETVEDVAAIGDSILRDSDVRVAVLYLTDGSIFQYRGGYTNPVINPSDHSDLSRRFRDRLIQERISGILKAIRTSWTPLFFLHLQNRQDNLNTAYQNGITQFAQETGGQALFCNSVAQVPAYLAQLMAQIRNLYSVELQVPDGLQGRVRVRLEASPGQGVVFPPQVSLEK